MGSLLELYPCLFCLTLNDHFLPDIYKNDLKYAENDNGHTTLLEQ